MVKLNRIYTRTGDAGSTGLVDGSRVSKACLRIAAIGEVDEANSAIGLALCHLEDGPEREMLGRDRKSTRLNSSHSGESRMPSSA